MQTDKTITKKFKGATLNITFKIPTALDAEKYIIKDAKNSDLVRAFVTKVDSEEIPTLRTAGDLLNMPGGNKICYDVAAAIVNETIVSDDEKN